LREEEFQTIYVQILVLGKIKKINWSNARSPKQIDASSDNGTMFVCVLPSVENIP